jgi:hypothetical protein
VWIGHGDDAVLDAGDVIRELAATYVVFDPWRAGQLAAELEREGMLCVAFPQSDSRMIPASARLHAAVTERRLALPDVEELHVMRRTRSPAMAAAAGVSTSRMTARRTTRSSRCARRWSRREPAGAGQAARVRVKRRCLTCRRLIDRGSCCPTCLPRPADPGRIPGRRNQKRCARLIAAQGGRCAQCGEPGPLELHHIDHEPANDDPVNHVMLCRRCHRITGGLPR